MISLRLDSIRTLNIYIYFLWYKFSRSWIKKVDLHRGRSEDKWCEERSQESPNHCWCAQSSLQSSVFLIGQCSSAMRWLVERCHDVTRQEIRMTKRDPHNRLFLFVHTYFQTFQRACFVWTFVLCGNPLTFSKAYSLLTSIYFYNSLQ